MENPRDQMGAKGRLRNATAVHTGLVPLLARITPGMYKCVSPFNAFRGGGAVKKLRVPGIAACGQSTNALPWPIDSEHSR